MYNVHISRFAHITEKLTDLAMSPTEACGTLANVIRGVHSLLAGPSIITQRRVAIWKGQRKKTVSQSYVTQLCSPQTNLNNQNIIDWPENQICGFGPYVSHLMKKHRAVSRSRNCEHPDSLLTSNSLHYKKTMSRRGFASGAELVLWHRQFGFSFIILTFPKA